jgi:P27 family predicted phage terminase small subunit
MNVSNAPKHLDDEARRKWAEVFAILQSRGEPLDAGTLDALSCYCSAWSQWLMAEAQVKALGLVVKSPAGFAQENPYLSVARKAQTELRRWGDVLKLTPKSKKGTRSANPSTPKAGKTDNPLAKLRVVTK